MREVVIVSAVRTPIGSFGGTLKNHSAVELGKIASIKAIARAKISPGQVDEVIFGNVLQAGLGQNPARQIAMGSNIPHTVPATTINKLCGSGLKSITMAVQSILAGDNEIVLVGGAESMTNAPYISTNMRWGAKMGDSKIFDTLLYDGLTDAFENIHMGITAENIAQELGITKKEQDEYAAQSQQRANTAILKNRFADEIVPVPIKQKKGDPIMFDKDEYPRFGADFDSTLASLQKLPAIFKKDGTVSAGNASGINDGAAALVVMSKQKAQELGVTPLATIVSYASVGVLPKVMGYGPIDATKVALKKAGMTVADIDLVEANEAFAAQALSVIRGLGLDANKTNVNGGAIALGHPIGCSGARVVTTLIHEMKKQKLKTGLATLCIGGGQGIAMIIEM